MQQNDSNDSLLEDIFEEPAFLEQYKKPIKRARITLFVLAGIQVLSLTSYFFVRRYLVNANFVFGISYTLLLATAFTGLGLWTKKKPYTAIIVALVLYTLLFAYQVLFYHYNWLSALGIRIIVYALLIKALKGAKEVQAWQDMIQKNK